MRSGPITYTVNYNGNGSDGGATAASTHTYDTLKTLHQTDFPNRLSVYRLEYIRGR